MGCRVYGARLAKRIKCDKVSCNVLARPKDNFLRTKISFAQKSPRESKYVGQDQGKNILVIKVA